MSILSRSGINDILSRRSFLSGSSVGLLAATDVKQVGSNKSLTANTADDRIAIQDLTFRYGFALDTLDAAALEACWVPGLFSRAQVENIIDYHRQYTHTMHNVFNHSYKVHNRKASGMVYCVASMVKAQGDRLTKFDVYLRYQDELVQQNRQWYFAKRAMEIPFSTEEATVTPGAPLLDLSIQHGSFRKTPPP